MRKELAKQYEPKNVEDRTYQMWMERRYFHAKREADKPTYTIVIPPPNITGQLHMGHALDNTLQDILIRYHRMAGYDTLWVPGTDHASIATEAKIVEAMKKEGLTKEEIGRDAFLERAWDWKRQYGGRIIEQLKKLGSSCDWERERFTLDEGCSRAVREVFCNLYESGLIYRGERIINWCPHCLTSISDAEVEYEEQAGHFWHLRYPFQDGSGYLELATTRPETLLGDTAVAVNPKDERYRDAVGKTLILPLVHREIPVVADEYVEMDFGTGVVKITPAHDPNDFEVGLRHNLPVLNVLTPDAKITDDYPAYAGMDRYEARKAIVRDLEKEGALVKVEDYTHNVGTCYRCGTTVEPRVSKQWFVKMKPLAGPAIDAVKTGETKFVPQRFEKVYFHWLENIRDWCISRQLWWGHRIPAWYCADCGEITVSRETPDVCAHCGSRKIEQDPDTLDTWFSSALWPFSTLGWPEQTEDFKHYYPTNTLVTGYDIIPFWVMRMMFSGLRQTGRVPFDTVLIHGLVRDAQGRKMSKSLGNGIDPLEIIDRYGADALRFTLATGNSPGNDMRFSDTRVEASRNFANKIWNAARFVLMNLSDDEPAPHVPDGLALEDKWILSRCNALAAGVRDALEKYELGMAVQKLYDFIWDEFCDWYIELAKIRLNGADAAKKATAKAVLVFVLSNTLKLLHPFMPFITEEIWQALPHEGESIMVSAWPCASDALCFSEEEAQMERIMTAIKAVRNRRAEMNVAPSKKAKLFIETAYADTFRKGEVFFERLASASAVEVGEAFGEMDGAVSIITESARMYIPMQELVDFAAETARLNRELAGVEKELAMVEGKLSNENFVSKAPAAVVEGQRRQQAQLLEKKKLLSESLASLEKRA
ncbi:MAG TPA: valine--tRNA ligase [Candidatus Fimenecus excrementigallinarum]|uniref:Valine--tRNA ligase n=1 Tax=Candidatus Fimenecus excrementigallinarum TaxID=2840816 RepID=A0A9D1IFI5_9FIRM|nr:valine--tRNA ligase [Candidatus Fimenecus excrementigallinarum]